MSNVSQCDPEAAQSIFSNIHLAEKTTLIPLDITHQVLVSHKILDDLLYGTTPVDIMSHVSLRLRPMLHDLLTYFADTYEKIFGFTNGPPLHDPVAVIPPINHALRLLDVPHRSSTDSTNNDRPRESFKVDVVLDGAHRGMTRVEALPPGEQGISIPRQVSAEGFWEEMLRCVAIAHAYLPSHTIDFATWRLSQRPAIP